jgi:peptidoglycan hydrolase-like protein with peptidoglycan-binding domain
MNNFYTKLFCLLFLFVFVPFFAFAYQFTKDLKIGDLNSDILELQKILNSDIGTAVSPSGVGSKGNETNYFGNLTKQAVVRFQEKYKNEILAPNGLSYGTGFVGVSTRKKLNSLNFVISTPVSTSVNSGSSVIPAKAGIQSQNLNLDSRDYPRMTNSGSGSSTFYETSPAEKSKVNSYFGGVLSQYPNQNLSSLRSTLNEDVLELFPSFVKSVKIYNVEPYQVKAGQKIVVNGTGFSEKNNVFSFGGVRTEGITCGYSTYCEVVVPNGASLGTQDISLENSNGNSRNQGFSAKVFVTNNPIMPSIITSAVPNQIKESELGANIIVKGERFAVDENYIYTPLGSVGPFSSSDGKTILFSLKEMKDISKLIERGRLLKTEIIPMPFRVNNEYGSSEAFFINLLINK